MKIKRKYQTRRIIYNRKWSLFPLALCFISPASGARYVLEEHHQQVLDDVSREILGYVNQGLLDGVSIGLVNKDGLIWSRGFGYANRETRVRADNDTVYRVGSLSKLLTATAILQMQDLELIDIDQAVSAYIPGFYYKTRFTDSGVITARHLLTHLSGLPTNISKGQWTEERFDQVIQRMRTEYTAYPTDFIMNYSNIGYSMLGAIIEENTDYLFEEYIQHHLFDPLGMTSSNFAPYGATTENAAVGYKKHQPQANLPIRDIPALGLNSNVKDLAKFLAAVIGRGAFQDKHILDASSVDSMFTVQNRHVKLDYDDRIGLPWFIDREIPTQSPLIVEHGGTTINFSSQIALAPRHGLGVVILTNTSRVNDLISGISKSLLNQLLRLFVATGDTPIKLPPIDESANRTGTKKYVARSGILELDKANSKLCDCLNEQNINLVPLPDGWFGISPDNSSYTSKIIEQNVDGKEVIVLEQGGKKHRIGSVYSSADNQFEWERHFGHYEIINPDQEFPVTDVEVFGEGEVTYICYRMPRLSDKLIVMPITPVSEKEAITEGLGRARGETIYLQEIDGLNYLIYSGYIAKKADESN